MTGLSEESQTTGNGDERAKRLVVIGAGVSGLAAAHRVHERAPGTEIVVLCDAREPGGVVRTIQRGGFLIEESADSLITAIPHGVALIKRLGLEAELLPTNPDSRRAFVVRRGRLVPIPDGLTLMAPSKIWPILASSILSPMGKLRLGAERFVRPGSGSDESLAAFARRRFGREAYERLIQPLVGGIYTGDPAFLSVSATMPQFLAMEQKFGSLIRATRHAARTQAKAENGGVSTHSGARYSLFVTLRQGLGTLVSTLVRALPEGSVRTQSAATGLVPSPDGGWLVRVVSASCPSEIRADAVILATPAATTAELVRPVDRELAEPLARVRSTSCAIVAVGVRREDVHHPLDGFGYVVPYVEHRASLSGSFSSVKFPGRAQAGHVLFRLFLGGARQAELVEEPDDRLAALATEELRRLVGLQGSPQLAHVVRWRNTMPQYEVGHVDRMVQLTKKLESWPTLALAGNAYRGVGIPHCIRTGEDAAERVVQAISART
jgi:oxygen-dependent protoporphyrinogen oxidase